MNPEVNPHVESTPEPPPAQATPEEVHARIVAFRQKVWDDSVKAERLKIAKRRGYINKDSKEKEIEDALLKVTLPGDEINYAKDKNGNPRLAKDRHGLLSFPKTRGRRKPHMTKHQNTVKSAAIGIFQRLFKSHGLKLEAAAKAAGEDFFGVPEKDLPRIGARAAMLALRQVRRENAEQRQRARRQQQFSRRVNWGLVNGNQRRRIVGGF